MYKNFPYNNWRTESPRSLRDLLSICRINLPAVLDGTKMFLYSVFFISVYKLVEGVISPEVVQESPIDVNFVLPQSRESGGTTAQNVQFLDANEGYDHDTAVDYDITRSLSMPQDVPLDMFMSRPLLLDTIDWEIGGPSPNVRLDIWRMYFDHPKVLNRITNYKLMQAKLCVKFVLNGNSFIYGRVMCSYTPLPNYDAYTRNTTYDVDFVELSQRPRVFLDPCTSQGGQLCLPFLYPQQSIDIVGQAFELLGNIDVLEIVPLRHANGSSEKVTISVFAWAEDVKLSVPTAFDPASLQPQAGKDKKVKNDEYGTGPVSRPASAVALVASKLTEIPVIGKFARATELAASATSKIASLFGFSRPPMVESHIYRNLTKNTIANSNFQEDLQKLSLDVKQEITVDTRVDGASGEDEMDILRIAQTETYFTMFEWLPNAVPETLLWNCVVTPALYRTAGSGPTSELHLTASAFASLPFKWWRGSMRFRFQVVASKFHRGRLRFVYDPHGTSATAPPYNVNYTTVVDISESSDFVIECGWGQPTLWRQVGDFTNPQSLTFDTVPLFYEASSELYGNGTLSVYVVNELTSPADDVPKIDLIVLTAVGDDFEVAVPNGEWMTRLRTTNPSQTIGPGVNPKVPYEPAEEEAELFSPQSSPDEEAPGVVDGDRAAPEMPNEIVLGENLDPTEISHYIHFGETFRNFRPLLKRYNLAYLPNYLRGPNANAIAYSIGLQYWALPYSPGYVPPAYSSGTGGIVVTLAGGNYAYGHMTLVRYLSSAYVGWKGGMRWMHDLGPTCCNELASSSVLTRASGCAPAVNTEELDFASLNTANAAVIRSSKDYTGVEGAAVQVNTVQPIASVEVPFYSNYRFSPARIYQDFDAAAGYEWMPCFKSNYTLLPNETESVRVKIMKFWNAAADDFSLSYYIGPPTFYIELAPPTA